MTALLTKHSELPPREQVVTAELLNHWAAVQPEAVFAVFEDGTTWTAR